MGRNAGFDDDPGGYDHLRRCWLNERRTRFIAEWLGGLPLDGDAGVLELGSGTGWLLRALAGHFPRVQFTGLEPIRAYVDFANRLGPPANLRFICGPAEQARTYPGGSYRAVLSNDVLHHVESMEATVQAVSHVAAPRCRWFAIEPNPRNPYVGLRQALKSGEQNFRPRAFLGACAESGWGLLERRHLFAIPPFFRQAPLWMQRLEQQIESNPWIAGGVCLDLGFGTLAEAGSATGRA